jgi:peroxiredoxin
MKKYLVFLSMALFAAMLFACNDKNAFTISGTITNPGSVKDIYLLELDSTQVSVADSTKLSEDGKFEFKHNGPYANFYKLRVGTNIFDLIAKNGDDINFTTDMSDSLHVYQLTGSDESEKMKEFNKISNVYTGKNTKLYAEYQLKAQALGKQSDSLLQAYMPTFKKNISDYANAAIAFMNANKTSLAGYYAATTLDADTYEQQLITYADDIKNNFKDNPSVQSFIKQMMAAKPISIGHAAPGFTVMGIDGKPISLSDYKGKYVMLDFWASWCGPCRQENPNVVAQYAVYHPKGLNILSISLDTSRTNWQAAITNDKLTWAHASDLHNFDGPTEMLYHIEAIPSNFIIDPQGIIVAKNLRGTDLEEFLNKTFK